MTTSEFKFDDFGAYFAKESFVRTLDIRFFIFFNSAMQNFCLKKTG